MNLFPQDSFLFSGTIRDAVDPYHRHSPELILSQLRRFSSLVSGVGSAESDGVGGVKEREANSSEVERHLLDLDFQIASNGSNVSAGEKQILVLVRASLSSAQIIILDEITSNMTIQTAETALQMLR